jgi:hypothetical protein
MRTVTDMKNCPKILSEPDSYAKRRTARQMKQQALKGLAKEQLKEQISVLRG